MAKSRRRETNRGRTAAPSYSSRRIYQPTPRQTAVRYVPSAIATRARALDHPVLPRTVRPPLMRTVLRDTVTLPNRRQTDLPTRAIGRVSSWTTYLQGIINQPPKDQRLFRATKCARRQIRREVLFAHNKTNGSGSRGVPKDKVKCK